jgi:hypothetical protein
MESHLTNKQRSLLAAALFLGAILPFLPTLPFGFVGPWDDSNYIVQNPWLGNLSLERILRAFLQPYYFNYHPLTILTYQLEYAVWGPWAPGFRTVNFIIHAATTVALLWMLRQFGSATFPSVILALFFAIHPLRVESVVWVSERKDVLCALMCSPSAAGGDHSCGRALLANVGGWGSPSRAPASLSYRRQWQSVCR